MTLLFDMKMTPLSTISAIAVLYVCYVQGQSECTTPTGSPGQCIPLFECPALMAILRKKGRVKEDLKLLKESHCGFNKEYKPKVCCEIIVDETDRTCFTPDANIGTCISLHSCPQLKNLLQPPITAEKIAFIQNSKCESPDQYSVCCGSQIQPAIKRSGCGPSIAPPDPRTECCGLETYNEDKILGGNATAIDQYPWLTILEYRGVKDNKIKLLCGGALISSKYVLTAGHCVAGPVLRIGTLENVRLGEYDTSSDGRDCVSAEGGGLDCTDPPVILPIEEIIPHMDYSPESVLKRNDIGLLRLKEEAPYTDFIRPICLPYNDIMQTREQQNFEVAGWGAVSDKKSFSNIKLHVAIPYKPLNVCQRAYEVQGHRLKLWKGQICAGGVKGKDSCKGDSGGPLMTRDERRIYQIIGIVSFGPTPCGMENVPGVYTKVYEYLPWIRSHMKP
ncbi:phenoloxidase-activating enzyme-like isoform X1 [Nymphalis io]|uniref:phenoloxidase-activating enzyme-like isoform X1 n=1 Tax=Inachis io TaxID=171585 RepID=UPI0021691AA7|nr:phenoloxidase-activating enzyme-like isoform X1 [Nymphalis io]